MQIASSQFSFLRLCSYFMHRYSLYRINHGAQGARAPGPAPKGAPRFLYPPLKKKEEEEKRKEKEKREKRKERKRKGKLDKGFLHQSYCKSYP